MIGFIRDLRLIPIALIASACLLGLKSADIAFGLFRASDQPPDEVSVSRPAPDLTQPSGAELSWAKQMFNFPDGGSTAAVPSAPRPQALPQIADNGADITGSVTTPGGAPSGQSADAKPAAAGQDGKPMPSAGVIIPMQGTSLPSGAERAILERLQERRQELDTRARELDIRESLIQSAEKRMDARLSELKDVEARIKVETEQKNDAEAAKLKGLVTMYESMKPRDAAKIFDRLDINVLITVSSLINPRQMAEILAQMSPDVAERLTVELASKAQQAGDTAAGGDLPKIQGQPTAP
jgi:flagellar motility protein MotE (MotC chaperone)